MVDEIYQLGFSPARRKKVSVTGKDFLKKMKDGAPDIYALTQEEEFQRWIKILKLTRGYVAHRGTEIISPILEELEKESTDAEIDRKILQSAEAKPWSKKWSREYIEKFVLPTERLMWKRKNYKLLTDEGFVMQEDGRTAIIFSASKHRMGV